jgi:thiol-disulfide isomerase/thioredoxin
MKPIQLLSLRIVCVFGAAVLAQARGVAEEKVSLSVAAPAAEADQAWEDLQVAKRAYSDLVDSLQAGQGGAQNPPVDPRAFMERVKELTGAIGDKAGAFLERFPKDERASEARELAIKMWSYLAILKDSVRARRYSDLLDACLADQSLPEEERAQMYLRKLQLANPSPDPKAAVRNLQALKEEFPDSRFYYCQLLSVARYAPANEGKALAAEVLGASAAPDDLRTIAQEIIDGKPPYQVGRPVEIRFTALDGREVDVSKMKGKVVLVDFWATWCGPCVKEIPALMALYEKYHDEGLEVVGISFDSVQAQLVRFVKNKGLPWPQYFEPWTNSLGLRYPVNGIPTVWLIGRDGNLAFTNAREGLEEKVVGLLRNTTRAAPR